MKKKPKKIKIYIPINKKVTQWKYSFEILNNVLFGS